MRMWGIILLIASRIRITDVSTDLRISRTIIKSLYPYAFSLLLIIYYMSKVILGIDPGFGRTGWGVIKNEANKIKLVDYGCIETKVGEDFSVRLKILNEELVNIIKKYKPEIVGVEELFIHKNLKTAIKVGQARGVILLTIIQANLPLLELTPLQVKQGVCAYGKADKKQVQDMVKLLLNLEKIPQPDDAADALAVAICTANSYKLLDHYEK